MHTPHEIPVVLIFTVGLAQATNTQLHKYPITSMLIPFVNTKQCFSRQYSIISWYSVSLPGLCCQTDILEVLANYQRIHLLWWHTVQCVLLYCQLLAPIPTITCTNVNVVTLRNTTTVNAIKENDLTNFTNFKITLRSILLTHLLSGSWWLCAGLLWITAAWSYRQTDRYHEKQSYTAKRESLSLFC